MNVLKKTESGPQRLGEILLHHGIIRPDQLETALREQQRSHRLLGEILVALGFMSPKDLYPLLGLLFDLPYIDLETQLVPEELLPLAKPEYLPFSQEKGITCIAMGDPHNIFLRYQIENQFLETKIYIADPSLIRQYATRVPSNDKSIGTNAITITSESAIELAQGILGRGIQRGASDIHFLPQDKITKVFYRLNGVLTEHLTLHQPQWLALKSHFKVLASLNLAENRRPQDGRFTVSHPLGSVDCRLSFIPTHHGESLVIRLLDQRQIKLAIGSLGFMYPQHQQLIQIAHQAQGLFIISGPTGSGKTTTLYALIQELIGQQKNIITVEDPIEYRIDGIRQSEVQVGVNTFDDLLRAMLRHDPDVIYISEIRDAETAQTAVRAAMTGHLVFCTMHTNSSCLIPQRLRDFGVSWSDLSGTLLGLMSQRLVRLLCVSCRGEGCDSCHGSGYVGRRAIAEILPCDSSFREICHRELDWKSLHNWRESLSCLKTEDVKRFFLNEQLSDQRELDRVFGRDLSELDTYTLKNTLIPFREPHHDAA
jgi:type II secretory ATPase GspE/PulE/Tfp pilus assembly ATPase PilB-like protein